VCRPSRHAHSRQGASGAPNPFPLRRTSPVPPRGECEPHNTPRPPKCKPPVRHKDERASQLLTRLARILRPNQGSRTSGDGRTRFDIRGNAHRHRRHRHPAGRRRRRDTDRHRRRHRPLCRRRGHRVTAGDGLVVLLDGAWLCGSWLALVRRSRQQGLRQVLHDGPMPTWLRTFIVIVLNGGRVIRAEQSALRLRWCAPRSGRGGKEPTGMGGVEPRLTHRICNHGPRRASPLLG
jgi:hypothetical protein